MLFTEAKTNVLRDPGKMAKEEINTSAMTYVAIADLFTKTRAQRSCAYARRGRELPKWLV